MRKYLYFRTVADEANDGVTGLKTNNPSSFLFPADSLTAIQPTNDGVLTLYFKPALAQGDNMLRDSVDLNVNEGDHYEVMSAITDAVANPARGHSDGFIVIADDVATTDSATTALNDLAVLPQYVHSSITSCGDITVQPTSVYGMHEYFETVDLPAADTADDAVLAALGIYIPAQATIVEASITAVELYSNDVGSVALEVHTTTDTDASAGTELIGADSAGNASLPNANLDVSSNAILGDTITGGTLVSHESPYDRGTNASYFHLVAKEDMSTTDPTGTAKVAVYLKWYGPAAIAL
tara:strand:+ start:242 stop:1129 length:888 start_codon:yes stop_codon:yes gene_type:complete